MAKIHGLLQEYVAQYRLSYKLHMPSPTERGETDVMSKLNAEIVKIGKPITMHFGKYVFKGIVGINKIEGTPKADVALVSWDGKKLADVCFISHKMGNSARDFQQYSGITVKADGKKTGSISQDKDVQAFLKEIAQPGIYSKIVKDKKRFYHSIKSKSLIGKSVYGPEYGASRFDVDNIHGIGQGNPILTKKGIDYQLSFSAGTHYNGDTQTFLNGDYKAVIGGRYTSGRNFMVGTRNYTDVRVLIIPLVVLGGQSQSLD
jgi:hypothetical protein